MTIHPGLIHITGCTCYRCKGIQIPPSALPTRTRQFVPRSPRYNSWEAGVAGETRPDGSFMPYLVTDPETGETRKVGIKEWSESPRLREMRRRQLGDYPAEVIPTPATT